MVSRVSVSRQEPFINERVPSESMVPIVSIVVPFFGLTNYILRILQCNYMYLIAKP